MCRIALFLIFLAISPTWGASPDWLIAETTGMQKITGPFEQSDFGFSVEAPPDLSEYVTDGNDADHGVRIILGKQRMVDVYPEYTNPDWGNDRPCIDFEFPSEDRGEKIVGTALLGTQTACEITVINQQNAWSLIQVAGEDRGQGILYTLLLTTSRESLRKDLASLHQIAATFKRIPIHP